MTAHLPPSLLALFAPRPSIPYLPPVEKKQLPPLTGIAAYVKEFEPPSSEPRPPLLSRKELKEKKIRDRKARMEAFLKQKIEEWDPNTYPEATEDAYKTLFVSRLNFSTTEHKLKREFENYGPVKKVRIVTDKKGKPRGYAFVEFEREKDMKYAYKAADGKKIDGRRILVDVEKGRTTRGWKPRRLGGGLGGTRIGGENINQRWSGREPPRYQDGRDRSRDREFNRSKSSGSRHYDSGRRERSRERNDRGGGERRRHRERSRERRD